MLAFIKPPRYFQVQYLLRVLYHGLCTSGTINSHDRRYAKLVKLKTFLCACDFFSQITMMNAAGNANQLVAKFYLENIVSGEISKAC